MLGHGKWLFEHIANCIYEFMEQENLLGRKFPLGFTFSFPCRQMGLASAQLVRWTKGFRCEDVEGYDVVKLLHDAIERKGNMSIECIAIINDPVGALMSGAHQDKNCHIGLILGTGTNCCYMEDLKNVELWDGDNDEPRQVIVNTEWGAFGDNGVLDFVRNPFDLELDRNSLNPGHQLFEKMISGMYMGEIVRLVLIQLTAEGLLFGGEGSEELLTRNNFLTKYISEIEGDKPDGNFPNTMLVLQELDIPHFTVDDCRHVQHVCWQVSQRAAYLAATAVAAVVNRLNRDKVTVCVDGSLYRFHPHFHDLMNKKIAQLIKPHHKFQLTQSHDGSGKGAALVAAVALRMRNDNESKIQDDNPNKNTKATTNTSSPGRDVNEKKSKVTYLNQRIEEEMV
jgi:hexokinase